MVVYALLGSSIGEGAALRGIGYGYGDAEPDRLDMDEPGRGLGLGGALSSIDSDAFSDDRREMTMVSVGSAFSCKLGILGLDLSFSKGPALSLAPPWSVCRETREDDLLNVEIKRGFRPLSSTFLRALALTQLIICRSASRSETNRVGRTDVGKPTVRGIVV